MLCSFQISDMPLKLWTNNEDVIRVLMPGDFSCLSFIYITHIEVRARFTVLNHTEKKHLYMPPTVAIVSVLFCNLMKFVSFFHNLIQLANSFRTWLRHHLVGIYHNQGAVEPLKNCTVQQDKMFILRMRIVPIFIDF